MTRFICALATVVVLALSPAFAQPVPGSSAISGTVRVEKSLGGSIQSVEIVAPTGEVTRVIGTARDAIAAHDGKTIEIQGPVAQTSDGTRTVIAETYKIQ